MSTFEPMINLILYITIFIIIAYLLGSIPNAVWIGKKFYDVDVREHGSHNAGATNTLRVLGRKAAIPVFLLDGLKGFFAVWIGNHLTVIYPTIDPFSEIFVIFKISLIIAVVLGHIFPVFAGFRGGKGVATITGALFAFAPLAITLSLVIFIVVWSISHYVSLGSMAGAIAFPLFTILIPSIYQTLSIKSFLGISSVLSLTMIIFSFIVTIGIVLTHKKNIKRLKEGTESKTYILNRKI